MAKDEVFCSRNPHRLFPEVWCSLFFFSGRFPLQPVLRRPCKTAPKEKEYSVRWTFVSGEGQLRKQSSSKFMSGYSAL